ncbi:oligosaccharyl transferase, archaeosortase A system-associated [Haloferax mediterranei ATCC 33500]|uniref:dolichyl-phosphooligosaccharide-protein glycotransferase n=1 Tax=Haloferax mediterranei (strain ATCC 33500 / DSM 1411 / JCM 8866 / NBRC 14739 / NCIMB 2177 / R-4) TaxID=523841 RepID=I3R4Y8_HALMT|nr:oligosaccharyl transferase, archaeosortase A system-associated [Haloferax mediterranei]AFK19298.1 transmembrane oligosaccharyl transferase / dolichyl-diphosphooligosaccharide--protein glycosyltransferase [Haloferax mediterranei ATCC 33500]AHZ21345.1 dolichyl-diphosphooligosaccharide--protein glycosyltransferase [Haloferax mediterranei ATCC 33500]EMA04513.1 transmembrane oligosaccharyl transferase / dolichyl-diphosphooligosaccharide--protein glycosyltransferase [Haloferax mediterranei ATCC 335
MSADTERIEDSGSKSVLELAKDWYHVPALLVILVGMLTLRLRSYSNFIRGGEVLFSGNDAWYHLREVTYTVQNWPSTMPFDPWTYFPFGTSVGQFGTIYDQIIATAALVVGLGSPSPDLVAKTLLVAPAVFGTLVAIPTFLIGRRLGGRTGGLFGVLILALLPGTFLRRGLVGFADHNIAEPFFQGFAVVTVMIALTVANREKPVWELVAARDFDALRSTLIWSALAGVAMAIYMWSWPPGVLLVGIFGLFLVLQMVADYVRGRSPEHVAFVGAVSLGVTGLLMFVPLHEMSFSATSFSLLQPVVSFVIALGAVFLAALARFWENNDVDDRGYPVAVGGLAVAGIVLISVVLPDAFNSIARNFLRTVGFSAGAATRTIGEAQPFLSSSTLQRTGMTAAERIMSEYGFTFFTGLVGAIWLVGKPLVSEGDTRKVGYVFGSLAVIGLIFLAPAIPAGIGGLVGIDSALISLAIVTAIIVGAVLQADYESEHLFVLVWAAIITSAAFTQVRFNYYLAVVVAVMNAYLLREILSFDVIGLADVDRLENVSLGTVAVVAVALLLILTPVLMVPIQLGNAGTSSNALESARSGPGGVTQWQSTFDWMQNNTPEEGEFGGASNEMEYYGTYKATNDFEYADGTYGVMSWWDYGHWITVLGERIPNANPFQQGAKEAANFLLAPNETQASNVLAEQSEEGNETRYVMVDWQMASTDSKFGAPTIFYNKQNVSSSDFYSAYYGLQRQDGQERLVSSTTLKDQRYYESLMVRLYEYHGSARNPSPIVVDWEERTSRDGSTTFKVTPSDNKPVKSFRTMDAAKAYVANDTTSQIGGLGAFPEERVAALEHYRLVKSSNSTALRSQSYYNSIASAGRTYGIQPRALLGNNPAWVKTFERVPGATVEGDGAPANATVTARVEMRDPVSGTTFNYTQQAQTDANGEFTMTLPYSTTGYDDYGPDNGYTNVSVRAVDDYTFTGPTSFEGNNTFVTYQATNVSVEEGLVNGAEDGTVQVSLEQTEQEITLNESSSDDSSSDDAETNESTSASIDAGSVPAVAA